MTLALGSAFYLLCDFEQGVTSVQGSDSAPVVDKRAGTGQMGMEDTFLGTHIPYEHWIESRLLHF